MSGTAARRKYRIKIKFDGNSFDFGKQEFNHPGTVPGLRRDIPARMTTTMMAGVLMAIVGSTRPAGHRGGPRRVWRLARAKPMAPAACRRRARRYSVPIVLQVDGRQYAVADWSLSGLRLTGWTERASFGEIVRGELRVAGEERHFGFLARVARFDRRAGVLGLEFLDVDRGAPLAVTALVARRKSRGEAAEREGGRSRAAQPWLRWSRLWPILRTSVRR
jgi:hypothetical protein